MPKDTPFYKLPGKDKQALHSAVLEVHAEVAGLITEDTPSIVRPVTFSGLLGEQVTECRFTPTHVYQASSGLVVANMSGRGNGKKG